PCTILISPIDIKADFSNDRSRITDICSRDYSLNGYSVLRPIAANEAHPDLGPMECHKGASRGFQLPFRTQLRFKEKIAGINGQEKSAEAERPSSRCHPKIHPLFLLFAFLYGLIGWIDCWVNYFKTKMIVWAVAAICSCALSIFVIVGTVFGWL